MIFIGHAAFIVDVDDGKRHDPEEIALKYTQPY